MSAFNLILLQKKHFHYRLKACCLFFFALHLLLGLACYCSALYLQTIIHQLAKKNSAHFFTPSPRITQSNPLAILHTILDSLPKTFQLSRLVMTKHLLSFTGYAPTANDLLSWKNKINSITNPPLVNALSFDRKKFILTFNVLD